MTFYPEDLLKLVLAVLAGGLIGFEREFRDKSAGFRTLIFISIGAAAFTMLSARLAPEASDPTRIAANIVTGIGFLGAGAILRDGVRITGLTTAATIWLTAALGMAIGAGEYLLAGIVTGVSVVVLWFFPYVEIIIDQVRAEHTYELICTLAPEEIPALEQKVRVLGLHLRHAQHYKRGEEVICSWVVSGMPRKHELLQQQLFAESRVKEFKY